MSWKHGRARGSRRPWPGHGPFSELPPWQRPGWRYGRGACWWRFPFDNPTVEGVVEQSLPPRLTTPIPFIPQLSKEQETQILEHQITVLQAQLDAAKNRINELMKE